VPDDLAEWIEMHVPRQGRLTGAPLFVNPASGNRWAPTSIRRTWTRACRNAGVPWVPPYEGTKHTWATNALSRGVRIEVVQAMLGHRDRRSTERYAKLRNEALVEAIGPRLQAGYKKAGSAEAKKRSR